MVAGLLRMVEPLRPSTLPMPPLPSVRRLLMTLAAACVVPIVALALASIAYHYHRERAALEAASIATARALMGAVDGRLHDVETALAGLATSPQLAHDTLAQFEQQTLVMQRIAIAARLWRTRCK